MPHPIAAESGRADPFVENLWPAPVLEDPLMVDGGALTLHVLIDIFSD